MALVAWINSFIWLMDIPIIFVSYQLNWSLILQAPKMLLLTRNQLIFLARRKRKFQFWYLLCILTWFLVLTEQNTQCRSPWMTPCLPATKDNERQSWVADDVTLDLHRDSVRQALRSLNISACDESWSVQMVHHWIKST